MMSPRNGVPVLYNARLIHPCCKFKRMTRPFSPFHITLTMRIRKPPPHITPLSPSLHSVLGTCGSTHICVVRNGIKRGVAHPTHFKRCEHGYFLTDFQRRNTDIVDEKRRLFA